MALGLGFKGAILGFGEESTYGTAVTPTKFIEMNTDGFTVEEERLHSEAVPGIYTDDDEVTQSAITVSGETEFEMRYEGMELLLKHAMGSVSTAEDPLGVYTHTFTLADDLPTGLTFEVDRDVSAFTVEGGKINTMAFNIEQGGFLKGTIGIAGEDMSTGTATSPTLPTEPLIVFTQGAITYGGSSVLVTSANFTLNNNLKVDRRFIGSRMISEPQRSAKIDVTGAITIEFDAISQYTDFRNATSRALVLTFTSTTLITGTDYYTMTITFPIIKLTGGVPQIADAGPITLELPFKAYATDSTTREFSIALKNALVSV